MEVQKLLEQLKDPSNELVFKASDQLAQTGNEEIVHELISLLKYDNLETRFLAARTLGLIKENELALPPLFEAINDKSNHSIQGDLVMALEGFDLSTSFIEIFKLYLFGSFKVSRVSKELLDFQEFTITPRVVKKCLKHWNHFTNNTRHDDVFILKKREVEEIIDDLELFLKS